MRLDFAAFALALIFLGCSAVTATAVTATAVTGPGQGDEEIRELKAIVAAQQKAIADLQKQVDAITGKAAAPAKKTAAAKPPAPASSSVSSSDTAGAAPAATTDGKTVAGSGAGTGKNGLDPGQMIQDPADLQTPDSPAAAILGVAPQKISHPSTPQEVIGSVISALDEHGNFQAGVAIDVAPYQIFTSGQKNRHSRDRDDTPAPATANKRRHEDLDWKKYLERVAERTQLSLATTQGTEDADKSTRIAFGIQTTLMNETDPIYKRAIMTPLRAAKSLGLNYEDAVDNRSWHYNSSWSVGAAQVIIARDNTSGNFRAGATGVYSTYSFGFEGMDHLVGDAMGKTMQNHAQLQLDTRYLNHDIVPDPAKTGTFMPEDSLRETIALRMGYPDINFSLNEVVTHEWLKSGGDTNYETDFAIDLRLPGSNTWITASMGKQFDRADGKSPLIVLGGVKIGFGDDR